MILQYVKLQNIRSYINEKIDFPTGSVLLSGDIGSGKSTILLAIEFALFGIKRGTYSGASLLRNGENNGSVEIKFMLTSGDITKEVIVNRTLKRTQNSIKQDAGFLIVNGEKMEGTPVELRAKVLDLLGYPNVLLSKSKDLIYRYTVYTPQEEMKQILFSDKEERLDTLRRVFDIDKYKRIRENLSILQKQMREQTKEYEGRIYALPEKTKQYKETIREANDITKTVKEMLPKLSKQQEAVASQRKVLDTIQEQFIELEGVKHKKEQVAEQLSNLAKQKSDLEKEDKQLVETIEKTQRKADEIKGEAITKEQLDALENTMETLDKGVQDARNENTLLREKISGLKEQIATLAKETRSKREAEKLVIDKRQELKNASVVINQKAELEKNLEKVEAIIEKLNNKITELGVGFANAQKKIEDISGISKCPTCHQDVSDKYRTEIVKIEKQTMKDIKFEKQEQEEHLKGYKERLEKTKENLQNLLEKEKEVERLKAELAALETSFKEFGAKKQQLAELEEKLPFYERKIIPKDIIAEKEEQLKKIKAEYKEKQSALAKQNEKILLLESIAEKKQRRAAIKEIIVDSDAKATTYTELTKQLEKKIAAFSDLEQKRKTEQEKFAALENALHEMQSEKAAQLSKREVLVKTKDSLEQEIIAMREIKEKIERQNELKNWLTNYFSKLTVVMEKHILMRVYNEFNALFQEWFNMLIEDEIITVRLDDEFTPIIQQNGFETSIEDLSGGEKTSCALAYRLALNRVINDCIDSIKTSDLIILDEPTDGFSTEQLDRLREVIDQLNISQIIIVSHESKIESFVDSTIRITKAEHVSSVI